MIGFDWKIKYSWDLKKTDRERIVQRKTKFYFIDKFEEIETNNNLYIVTLKDNISSKEELLNEYYAKLKFPSYFGFNWDALNDCLVNLDNIQQEKVVIYHHTIPLLNEENMKIYLSILKDSTGEWVGMDWCTNNHVIYVYFNSRDYDRVQQIVRK